MSTIHNTQYPESQLKKKSNSICYHAVREAVAMGELLTGHVKTDENLADHQGCGWRDQDEEFGADVPI